MNKFYITTAIPYVNGDPHIGHALGFVQADVIARWHRAHGEAVRLVAGTDENSIKNVQAAQIAGKAVQEFVDLYAAQFKDLLRLLNISNDDFIRTTEPRNIAGAQKLWRAIEAAGDIYKKKYSGLYCTGCEQFYGESELENGLCPEHKMKPEFVEEENYFFRLSKYQSRIEQLLVSGELRVIPEKRAHEMLTFVREGLQDFSISRSRERAKNWGVAVPGDDSQIQYVWFDALANYINVVGYGTDEAMFKEWWADNPNILHHIGKGIARFHVLYWPGMLLSAGLRLPKEIFINGYFTVNGEKISKSLGNTINPIELVQKYGTDPVRYFMLRGISPTEDGDYSDEKFRTLYNADLANGLGNFVQRVTTLAEKVQLTDITEQSGWFEPLVAQVKADVKTALEQYRFDHAVEAVWKLIAAGDGYVNETKVWEKSGEEQLVILADLTSLILNIANLLDIFLPATASEIAKRFGLTIEQLRTPALTRRGMPTAHPLAIIKADPLFKRL